MSPNLRASKEASVGKDNDEREGTDAGGRVGARQSRDVDCEVGGCVAGGQLSAGEARGAPLSAGRRERPPAWECRSALESRAAGGGARARVLALIRKKYGGAIDVRFGPT